MLLTFMLLPELASTGSLLILQLPLPLPLSLPLPLPLPLPLAFAFWDEHNSCQTAGKL